MAKAIEKVCVIGAGVMGAGIAAQLANAGTAVLLLDVPKNGVDRDAVAKAAVARMLKTEPAPFMSGAAATLVETGNIADHLPRVAECDWIIEAVVERLDVKQDLYARLEQLKRPDAAVSSNTSTIPLALLIEGRSEAFKRNFLITHFFNPPRHMRLAETVRGPKADPEIVERIEQFIDHRMGKRVVRAKDTPGFIANRIGIYWVAVALNAAMDHGLTVEEADQVAGPPMGIPKTGVFGLMDLIGVDLMPAVLQSLVSTLPKDDPFTAAARPMPLVDRMIAEGLTGRKGGGGFYRLEKGPQGARVKLALDLATGAYRPERRPEPLANGAEKDLVALISLPGQLGAYAWSVLSQVLSYAAQLVGEVADDVVAIDDAMKLGFNWRFGPFELIDKLGAARLAERLRDDGGAAPPILELAGDRAFYRVQDGRRQYLALDLQYRDVPTPEGVLRLEEVTMGRAPLAKNGSAALWDIGDGCAALAFTTKMNTLDPGALALIETAIPLVAAHYKALVIYSDSADFSAGADLRWALSAASRAAWDDLERLGVAGQQALKALKYAPFPVVSAVCGRALGGGCEILLHSDAVQAHAESYIGLVECAVGLLPGWGGNGELLDRWATAPGLPKGPMPAVFKAFEMISTAQVSKSAAHAREMLFLRPSDGITMNRDRLLADAKAKALSMVEGYRPPEKPTFRLPGESGRVVLAGAVRDLQKRDLATAHDAVVASRLAQVLTGGDADLVDVVEEAQLLALERQQFMAAVRDPATQARIRHMLETGKPLRN